MLHWGTSGCIIFIKRDGFGALQDGGFVVLGKVLWGKTDKPLQAYHQSPKAGGSQWALPWGFWSKFSQKFWSESWFNLISMAICDISIYVRGQWNSLEGVWKGWWGSLDTRTGLAPFPSQRQQLHPCPSPFGNGVVVQLPGVHITHCQGWWVILHPISVLSPHSKTLMGNTGEGEQKPLSSLSLSLHLLK